MTNIRARHALGSASVAAGGRGQRGEAGGGEGPARRSVCGGYGGQAHGSAPSGCVCSGVRRLGVRARCYGVHGLGVGGWMLWCGVGSVLGLDALVWRGYALVSVG